MSHSRQDAPNAGSICGSSLAGIPNAQNDERLHGENRLLLTPTVDHLFDRGFISFENNGDLLIFPVVHRESLKRLGIPLDERQNLGAFSEGQRRYLEYHRDLVFLEARVTR
jgi:hypothetical protein